MLKVKSGTIQDVCTISVTHSRPTLSTKDQHYVKVHENGENERGAEIPSKLNSEYLKNNGDAVKEMNPKGVSN